MANKIVFTGIDTDFGEQFIEKALKKGNSVCATRNPESELVEKLAMRENLIVQPWNKRSPISVRNVFLTAYNKMDAVDEVFIYYTAMQSYAAFHEMSMADIEETVDSHIKAYSFMAREALAYFQKRRKGSLFFILHSRGYGYLPPIASAMYQGVKGLADNIITYYKKEPMLCAGFECTTEENEPAIDFINRIIEQKQQKVDGKWYTWSGKPKLFPFG